MDVAIARFAVPTICVVLAVGSAARSQDWPALPNANATVSIPAQEWPQRPGARQVKVAVYYPDGTRDSVSNETGLMLTLHNWGGSGCAGTASPTALANRLNVVAICVDYLQSGRKASIEDPEPYDFGYLQSLDALRALWFVYDGLAQQKIAFSKGRIFATGGSGGGNVTQMVNKLAPRTFACVIDMCGMAKLSDDIAFNLPGGSGLNARWSQDPNSKNYLSPAAQELRFIGNPVHLAAMKKLKSTSKVIVVHGVNDRTCPFKDKQELVENMQTAGLNVEPFFIGKSELDGKIFTSTGHALGNRTEIVFKVGGELISPDNRKVTRRRVQTDFDRRARIGYAVTGGEYVISYAHGYPVSYFVKADWPPALPGVNAVDFKRRITKSVSIDTPEMLQIPSDVVTWSTEAESAKFVVAKKAPRVDFAIHGHLGENAISRRLWSSWGDICLARDGIVYCGIGDHNDDAGGDARCFIYRWDPRLKQLEQIVDMNKIVPPGLDQPAWSKVHAKIDQGQDGKIYFNCTLNAGSRAGQPNYKWNKNLPGGQVYQFDPATNRTKVFANLPPKRCSATSRLDVKRNIWWCNLEAGDGNALFGLNLTTRKVVFQSDDGSVAFNRSFAITNDGSIIFNGESSLMKYDSKSESIQTLAAKFANAPGMRSATHETKDGFIYGSTYKTNELYRYDVKNDSLKMLGPTWLTGQYTTVMEISPDERFLYYLPGAHGKAYLHGTPVIQYEIKTGARKVLAFLAPSIKKRHGYVPAGTYGVKVTPDGSTLYVNFNGHPVAGLRPARMKPNGFGLCSFIAIHIPETERQ
jgi:predicted esterase/streptogramin lyase